MTGVGDPEPIRRHAPPAPSGGPRVVTEAMPGLRSVAVGFWVGTGGIDEPDERLGASHFLEHLLFKGTASRSASDIANAVESVGGDMNAFTTQEYTAFYVRVPDEHLELAVDILSDVVWAPAFRPDEVESERQVILEEIRMRDDDPDDVAHELLAEALFPGHPLGRPVLGTMETIGGMSRDEIAAYHGAHYVPSNVVVAAAGNLDHERVVKLVQERLGERTGVRPAAGAVVPGTATPVLVRHRPTEQAHVVLGMRSVPRDHPDRYTLMVLNQALGGGMSSRLFQEIRERRGLAYSVYSYRAAFTTTGMHAVYVGTAPERVHEALGVVHDELDRLVADGLAPEEFEAAKGHLKGSTALALESSASRMHRIGRSELTLGEVPTLDEVVAHIDAVTLDDLTRVVGEVLAGQPRSLAVVGPFDAGDFD